MRATDTFLSGISLGLYLLAYLCKFHNRSPFLLGFRAFHIREGCHC